MKQQVRYEESLAATQSKLNENLLEARLKDHIEFHFDVPGSMISAKTLTTVADGIQNIADSLLAESTAKNTNTSVYIRAPKDGCFQIEYIIVASLGTIIHFCASPFLNSLSKGLVGKSIDEIVHIIGHATAEELKSVPAINYISTIIAIYLDKQHNRFVTEDKPEFKRQLRKLQEGKNIIYQALEDDTTVSQVSLDGYNMIHRDSFSDYVTSIPEDENLEYEAGYYEGEIKVISPVSILETSRRGWTGYLLGSETSRAEKTFAIDDEHFKQHVIVNNLKPAVDDLIEVQMVKSITEHPQWRIVKVLRYKGIKISPPLTEEELVTLAVKPTAEKHEKQYSLLS